MKITADPPLVFGLVPSRRLGKSVGINNIPPKICTYSCIYCQLGTCAPVAPQRQCFYDPGLILAQTCGSSTFNPLRDIIGGLGLNHISSFSGQDQNANHHRIGDNNVQFNT